MNKTKLGKRIAFGTVGAFFAAGAAVTGAAAFGFVPCQLCDATTTTTTTTTVNGISHTTTSVFVLYPWWLLWGGFILSIILALGGISGAVWIDQAWPRDKY